MTCKEKACSKKSVYKKQGFCLHHYYLSHKEGIFLSINKYRRKNRKTINVKQVKYYYKNRDSNKPLRLVVGTEEWIKQKRFKRTEYTKKYRATAKGKEATLRAIKKYEANHPERRKAWQIFAKSNLPKEICTKCGKEQVHAHHDNPLEPLHVIFLCPLHHKQQHML